jgi:cytidylate kinase
MLTTLEEKYLKRPIKISITGDLGSGKSTVCRILEGRLGLKIFSTGAIQRGIAAERGMSTFELNKYMETHPELDAEIDGKLAALSDTGDDIIIDSRMAWHFVKNTFKVYLTTDSRIAARRVFDDNRGAESYADVDDAVNALAARKKSEIFRYGQKYGVDCFNLRNYDIVADTSVISPGDVADIIVNGFAAWSDGQPLPACLLPPERLIPMERMGGEGRRAAVVFCDNYFYIFANGMIVPEYFRQNKNKIPCDVVAVGGEMLDGLTAEEYVKANVSRDLIEKWEAANGFRLLSLPEWLDGR